MQKGWFIIKKDKIVIITNGNYFSKNILTKLFEEYKNNIYGVIIVYGDYYGQSGLKTLWNIGTATVPQYTIYKLFQFIAFKIANLVFYNSTFFVEDIVKKYNISLLLVKSVNSDEVFRFIQKISPKLIVSVSCPQRISEKLIRLASYGGINIHSSLLPTYAGLAPYYWVLSKGEKVTGISVHYLTKRFDAGNILVQKTINIEAKISVFELFKKLSYLGNSALHKGVALALNGDKGQPQDLLNYSYYSHPTKQSYNELKQKGHTLIRFSEIFKTIIEEVKNH